MPIDDVLGARTERVPQNDVQNLRKILTDPDLHATPFLVWFLDHFVTGDRTMNDVFAWHPATIRNEIERTVGPGIPKNNFGKLMAAITIKTTDLYFKRLRVFLTLSNVLAGDGFQPDEFEPPDSVECAWAMTEAAMLDPFDFQQEADPFCDDIRHYLSHMLKEEGYLTPPDVLGIAIGGDRSHAFRHQHGDDPELIQSAHVENQRKHAEVKQAIASNLHDLMAQLKSLPLKQGNIEKIEKQMSAALANIHQQGDQRGSSNRGSGT